MVGPSTAAPRAPSPRPMIPPSMAWFPVVGRDGVPPKKNLVSASFVPVVEPELEAGSLGLVCEEVGEPPLPKVSWLSRGPTRVVVRMTSWCPLMVPQ